MKIALVPSLLLLTACAQTPAGHSAAPTAPPSPTALAAPATPATPATPLAPLAPLAQVAQVAQALPAAQAAAAAADAAVVAAFHGVFERWLDERSALDPNWSTRIGRHAHDGELTRYDDAAWHGRAELASRTLAAIEAIDPAALTPEDAVDWRLFRAQLRVEAHEYARRDLRTLSPGFAVDAIAAVNDLLIRDFAPRDVRAAHAVQRLLVIPAVCADLRAVLGRPPKVWTDMAIEDTTGALQFLDSVPALAGEVPGPAGQQAAQVPGLSAALDAARTALTSYRDFLVTELLPRSDSSFALGRAEFDWLLHENYLLAADFDADALLALGQKQFDLTLALLEATARQIAPGRDWRALLAEMMEQHPSADTLMPSYRDEVARSRQFLLDHRIVGIPAESLQILETPEFMRSAVPFAAYESPAPLDASRLGTFFVSPPPEAHILSDIPGTTWHEAYPGHHLQFVYAKDNPSLIRRLNESPLLSEGWGFYCEELAHETGYYDDPRERLMQLNWRLQRAARVILDVSVHTQDMSWAQAVDFLVRAVGMNHAQAEGSVNAYTRQPTYFSSYMLGMLEIQRIREEFRERLGERFSLQEFHERLLRVGNVPPALIEAELLRTWQ